MTEKPLIVEVFAYAPTAFYHCAHCETVWREIGASQGYHQEQLETSLPKDLTDQYQQLSDWVVGILDRFRDQVAIKVIDAASAEGFVKSLRYGIHHYPAVVVNHRSRFTENALENAREEIQHMVKLEA